MRSPRHERLNRIIVWFSWSYKKIHISNGIFFSDAEIQNFGFVLVYHSDQEDYDNALAYSRSSERYSLNKQTVRVTTG